MNSFEWLPRKRDAAVPPCEHLAALWTVRGVTGRDLTCSAYGVATGLELRVAYSELEIVATKLYRGVGADEQVAEAADGIRLTMLEEEFRDISRT